MTAHILNRISKGIKRDKRYTKVQRESEANQNDA